MKNKVMLKEKINNSALMIKKNLIVDRLNAIEWALLCIVLIAVFLTLFYDDNPGMFLTYFWANNGLLRGGDIHALGSNQTTYGIVQQFFCEIWCLPVNIAYLIHPFVVHNPVSLLWFKLSMVLFIILSMREMVRLGKSLDIDEDRIKWMLILFCSTILVALPVFHIAQTDILYGYLILVSIRYYFEDNLKRFILFGAMAVSCKGIAVIVIIPLILLREKKILRIIVNSILTVSIFVGERLWYRVVDKLNSLIHSGNSVASANSSVIDETSAVGSTVESTYDKVSAGLIPHFYNKALFFEIGAVRKGYVVSILVVLFVLLCIWCFAQKKEDTVLYKQKSIYAIAVAWLIFFTYASPSPYWIVVLYPFLFLLMFINYDRIRINLLLETCFTLTMFLVYVVDTFWVYGGANNLDLLLLRGLLPEGHVSNTEGPYVARYLNNLGVGSVMNVVTAICLACAIGLVAVNYYNSNIKEELDEKYEKTLMHGFTIFQIVFLYVWYAVNVFVVSRW